MDFKLSQEHQLMLQAIQDFAQKEVQQEASARDEYEEFSRDIFKKMGEMGLTGIPWPEKYGGAAGDYLGYVLAVEELSRIDASVGVTLSAHVSLCSWPIFTYANEEQKERYLAPLAAGEALGAFALTEPEAGSDAGAIKTTAAKEDNGYRLSGSKIFVTNGGEADIYIVFASTDRSKKARGISAFIIEKGTPGFSFGKKEKKLGIRSSTTAELIFEDCLVPAENLLGREGEGFKIAMKTLDGGRNGIAAQAVGIAQGALDTAVAYAREREQFGQPIGQFQGISFMLADMATKIEAARLLTYQAAVFESKGEPYAQASAMAKLFASDAAMDVTTNAVQVLGGYGYTREYPAERFMRDAKITQIYEGTNEIQRLVIARNLLKSSAR